MAIVVHTVNLQVAKTTTELFMVNQNESRSQAFAITVYDANYQPIDLSGAANVTLQIQKPDGTLAQVPAESVNFKTAVFIPNVQAFTASGDCTCFLQAVGPTTNQYDFTACPFTIRVHQTRFNQITSENDFAQIALLVAAAQGAESWAVGGTGTRPGENTNNAKYWAQQAQAVVIDTGWIEPPLLNGFTQPSNTTEHRVAYRRIGNVVYVRGTAYGGAAGNAIFSIPAAYRPTRIVRFLTTNQSQTYSRIGVADGNLSVTGGAIGTWVSLDSVYWHLN